MKATWEWLAPNRPSEPRCGGQGWIKRVRDIAEHAMGVSWWHGQIPLNLFDPPHYPMDPGKTYLGPLPSGHSLLIIVDYYSRFYEVEVMQSTEKIIDRLADTFCRHGLPNTIRSDNGPQFKSNEFREYCEQHSIIHQKVTAKWAQANGEIERQNRSLLKRLQIAQAENKPWRAELRKYFTAYRSFPHNTTGRSPAELLFNRKVNGKIPAFRIDHAYDHEVHDHDAEQKAKSKAYADIHCRASPSSIDLGD